LEIGKYRGLRTVDHGGADAGYRSDLVRFPDQHFSVACLCNKGETNPSGLARRVADIYLAKQFTEPAPGLPANGVVVSSQQLKEYPGVYWKKDGERLRNVTLKDGKLFMGALELIALSESRFQLALDPDEKFSFASQRMTILNPGETPDVLDRIPELHPTPVQLAACAGFYASDEIDPIYRIVVEDGGLVLKRLKAKPQKLRPVVEDYFEGPGIIHFQKDPAGKVTGFVLNSGRISNFHFKKTAQM
jgi:hypothetical protein